MRKLILGLIIGLALGASSSLLLDKDTNFDLGAGLKNGGLTLDQSQTFDGFPQGQGSGVSALPSSYIGQYQLPAQLLPVLLPVQLPAGVALEATPSRLQTAVGVQ